MTNDPSPRPGPPSYAQPDEGPGARLSIGALSRATGIPIETLRTWEARYGFPTPERKPSGHRLYAASNVARLRHMAEAIARGHRASTAVGATDAQLAALLETTASTVDARYPLHDISDEEFRDYLDAVVAFDGDRLTRLLRGDAERLGPLRFVDTRVAPLVTRVGDAWHAGTLHVRHEHFFTQRLEDHLRAMRASLDADASGPVIVFATLPGETHALGLQMAALVVAERRCRVLYLGTDMPPADIADLARDIGARAVALSVSAASNAEAVGHHLAALRASLPRRVTIILGGTGAAGVADDVATRFTSFAALSEWAAGVAT